MFGKVSRVLLSVSLLALAAGCTSSEKPLTGTESAATTPPAGAPPATAPVVEGTCPQVVLREGTAYHRTYAKGAKDDPEKVIYQASLADTTRNCTMTDTSIVVNVVAQGRLIAGPMGKPGRVTLPIRVAATDGSNTLYSELVKFEAEIPAGTAATQFIFTKSDVTLPGGSGRFVKIYIGFDEGPYNTK